MCELLYCCHSTFLPLEADSFSTAAMAASCLAPKSSLAAVGWAALVVAWSSIASWPAGPVKAGWLPPPPPRTSLDEALGSSSPGRAEMTDLFKIGYIWSKRLCKNPNPSRTLIWQPKVSVQYKVGEAANHTCLKSRSSKSPQRSSLTNGNSKAGYP